MMFGGKAKSKHRKAAAAMQTPFTRESLAKIQEDARNRGTAEYRGPAQAKFDAAWGLDRDDAR